MMPMFGPLRPLAYGVQKYKRTCVQRQSKKQQKSLIPCEAHQNCQQVFGDVRITPLIYACLQSRSVLTKGSRQAELRIRGAAIEFLRRARRTSSSRGRRDSHRM